MEKAKIRELVSQLTLEEKAGLCSGEDFWRTKAVERLNVPQIMVSDGPHGLRKQDDKADHLGVNDSIKAVCFPTGCASASSFNRELIKEMGEALGEECRAEGVAVLLGPGVCIKRSPLCGRNFEYFSEDPYLAGEIATSFIKGVQSKNVGVSIKHFLANSQEHRRMSSDAIVDERTLREIYLPAFEKAVKEAKPWTVMCSYNKINGKYAADNKRFLTRILRDEWGFDGVVVSDWGAVNDRVSNLNAGLDLEMPSSNGFNDKLIVEAVKAEKLDEAVLDRACERILDLVFKYTENAIERYEFDRMADHKKAMETARETITLLKNDNVLPLKKGVRAAFIGQYADKPRFQGGGSSHINTKYVTSALDFAKTSGINNITWTQGYDDTEDEVNEALIEEAVMAAAVADVAVIFAGLPDSFESEGFDRRHLHMPDAQNELIERVARVQQNVVVVLHNGAPVEMPWIDKVGAVLETYLSGEGVGAATVEILYGDVNPSARLAETFPLKLEDNPSYLYYFGEGDRAEYREGIYVGYRYYDKKKTEVLFPFGHGLSYTSFEYSGLKLDKHEMDDTEELLVSVNVKNTGERYGKEVVQLYVGAFDNDYVMRPVKELKGFEKVGLEPGETKTVSFKLSKRDFAYYETGINDWFVESGEYRIMIGRSAENIVLFDTALVKGTVRRPFSVSTDTTCGDVVGLAPECNELMKEYLNKFTLFDSDESAAGEAMGENMVNAQMMYNPLRGAVWFALREPTSMAEVKEFADKLNAVIAANDKKIFENNV